MTKKFDADEFTATDLRIAMNEGYRKSIYGAVPIIDQYDVLQAFHGVDEAALADDPQKLAAIVIH